MKVKSIKKKLKNRFAYLTKDDLDNLWINPDELLDKITDTSGYTREETVHLLNNLQAT